MKMPYDNPFVFDRQRLNALQDMYEKYSSLDWYYWRLHSGYPSDENTREVECRFPADTAELNLGNEDAIDIAHYNNGMKVGLGYALLLTDAPPEDLGEDEYYCPVQAALQLMHEI